MDLLGLVGGVEAGGMELEVAATATTQLRTLMLTSVVIPVLAWIGNAMKPLGVTVTSAETVPLDGRALSVAATPPQGGPVPAPARTFAVIVDEPFLTIVFDEGEFKGTIVDATLDKLEEARVIAAQYNLIIDHVWCDNHRNFDLHLSEKGAREN